MLFPWVKLATTSLNVGTSATFGGICSYCLFGGDNKEEIKEIDEIRLEIQKTKEGFETKKKETEEEGARELKALEAEVTDLVKVQNCLEGMRKAYEKKMDDLTFWQKYFSPTIVKYAGDSCGEKINT